MKLIRRNGFYYLYYGHNLRKSLRTKDKEEAVKLFEMEKEEIRRGKIVEFEKKSRISLAQFKQEYIASREGSALLGDICEGTLQNDKRAFTYFLDSIGDIPLRKVDRRAIDIFKTKLLQVRQGDENQRKNGINVLLRCMRSAFSYAVGRGYIDKNPFFKEIGKKEGVLFNTGKRKPRFLTSEEIAAIEEVLKGRIEKLEWRINDEMPAWQAARLRDRLVAAREFSDMVHFYLYSGLRRSELLKLQWTDINHEANVLHIRETKTKEERYVPIAPQLRALIDRMGIKDIGPLFPRWRSPETVTRLFRSLADEAGTDKTLHTTRHSFGSYGAMSGMNLKSIQKAMGHSDIKTTMIYADVADETMQSEIKKLKFRIGE